MKLGNASLWVGTFESEEQVDEYVEAMYRECENERDCDNCNLEVCVEDDIYSVFEKKFLCDNKYYCDEDFREVTFHEKAVKSIDALIEGHSYDDQIVPKFMESVQGAKDVEGNTVIILYDCDYKGEIKNDVGENYKIEYIGTVEFDSDED